MAESSTPYQLFPVLDAATEAALRASIDRWGVLVAVAQDQHGNIIDGHHRARIADQLGVPYRVDVIRVESEDDAREMATTLNMARRHLEPEQRRQIVADLRGQGHSLRAIGNALGVSKSQVANDLDELSTNGQLDQPEAVRGLDGKVRPAKRPPVVPTTTDRDVSKAQQALGDLEEVEGPIDVRYAHKQAKRAAAVKGDDDAGPRPPIDNLEVVPDTFSAIVIDPPWRYGNVATRGAAEDHYGTMTQTELLALELPAADNSHLYLWVTNSFLADGLALVDAWGFQYKTCLTWCKPQIGMGNYFRSTTEHVLFGMRGRHPTLTNNTPTHFVADRQRHSQKPESFYDLVEASSPGPYLEMFARRRRFGWHVWGNEA